MMTAPSIFRLSVVPSRSPVSAAAGGPERCPVNSRPRQEHFRPCRPQRKPFGLSDSPLMRDFIKHKLAKLGCFFAIAVIATGATFSTKVILGWFEFDETQKTTISNSVGDYVGKGLLAIVVLLGFVAMGFQLVAELRAKRGQPPVSGPPPLPPHAGRSLRELTSEHDQNLRAKP